MTDDNGGTQQNSQSTRRRKKWLIAVGVAFLGMVVFYVSLYLPVYCDMAFICEHTASRKGCRIWFMGLRTRQWYSASQLERFMAEKHPQDLTHRWVSCMGTEKGLLGRVVGRAHGDPNFTLMMFRKPFDDHVDTLDDAGKLELFHVLAAGQKDQIEAHLAPVRERPFEPFRGPQP